MMYLLVYAPTGCLVLTFRQKHCITVLVSRTVGISDRKKE